MAVVSQTQDAQLVDDDAEGPVSEAGLGPVNAATPVTLLVVSVGDVLHRRKVRAQVEVFSRRDVAKKGAQFVLRNDGRAGKKLRCQWGAFR